jgi:hypothetical protein
MGRWGSGLYQSDDTLDYFGDIGDQVETELYTCLAMLEDKTRQDKSHWLAGTLTGIEILLLFEQHHFSASGSLHHEELIQSWRETFFSAWDGDWQDEKGDYPYGQIAYRRQHRPAVARMFDRLESIASYWSNLTAETRDSPITPLLPDYPLPFFSIQREKSDNGKEWVSTGRFIGELIDYLVRDIIYRLSAEKRHEATFYVAVFEEVCVAVDLLGLLCQSYEQSCGIRIGFIRAWRTTTLDIWKASHGRDWSPDEPTMQNVMAAFDRLDAVAQKYPAPEW